ncbi:dUTP diphosphatase [Psychrobacillus sp. FSL K6-4615]|uniref:dUTP diphosphatase n=1 Tax=Psychrobacillus sp. FSL K6-4615 TaxID=2921551 RepID=UPI0030FCC4E1
MNLAKLFETQRLLDEHILDEHPELKGQNNLDWKILALQVELGECANQWRGFKKWSNDQESRTSVRCPRCSGEGTYAAHYIGGYNQVDCSICNATGSVRNPLLEEYVDCLHFILSIGLECDFDKRELNHIHEHNFSVYKERTILIQFEWIFLTISDFTSENDLSSYEELFLYFVGLGIHLGFEIEQIEQAYYEKNKINHKRQESGY